jgi:hypothetical protein
MKKSREKFITTIIILVALTLTHSLSYTSLIAAPVDSSYIFVNDKDFDKVIDKEKDLEYVNSSEIANLKKILSTEKKAIPDDDKDLSDRKSPQWIIRKTDYKGVVEGDSAQFTINQEIISYTDKPFDYFPPSNDIVLVQAFLNDKPVNLRLTGQTLNVNRQTAPPWLTITGKGKHNLRLRIIVPVSRFGNVASLLLTTPRVSIASLELEVDEPYASVDLAPSAAFTVTHPSKTTTVVTSKLPVHNSIFVKWNQHSRVAAKTASAPRTREELVEEIKPLLFESNIDSIVVVNDTTVNNTTWLTYKVKQGKLKSLKIVAPHKTEIISVTGANIFEWHREEDTILVKLETAYSDSYELTINALEPLPKPVKEGEAICSVTSTIKGFVTESASSEKGYISVLLSDEGELISPLGKNLTRIDPSELKGKLRGLKSDIAVKYLAPGWEMPFSVVRRKQIETSRVTVSSSTSLVRLIADGPALIKQSWMLTNSGEQFLPVELPSDSALLSCFVKDKPTDTGFARTSGTLKIPLIKSEGQAGSYSNLKVEITYASFVKKPGLYGTFKIPLAKIPYLVKSATATVIGPSGWVINDGNGTMDCENVNSLSRWYRKFTANPVRYFLEPAVTVFLGPLLMTSTSGSFNKVSSMNADSCAPMAEYMEDQIALGGAYRDTGQVNGQARLSTNVTHGKLRPKKKQDKYNISKSERSLPPAPGRMEEQKIQIQSEGLSQSVMDDFDGDDESNLADYSPSDQPVQPQEISKDALERARFIATMKKSSGSKGNLPVRIDVDKNTSGSRLSFSQELLFTDDKVSQTIKISYAKEGLIPLIIFVNGILCFFIALLLYQGLSDRENVTNLLIAAAVIVISDMWLMHLLPDLDLLDHSLYAFYIAIPVHFVRLIDLWVTKSVARYRSRRMAEGKARQAKTKNAKTP